MRIGEVIPGAEEFVSDALCAPAGDGFQSDALAGELAHAAAERIVVARCARAPSADDHLRLERKDWIIGNNGGGERRPKDVLAQIVTQAPDAAEFEAPFGEGALNAVVFESVKSHLRLSMRRRRRSNSPLSSWRVMKSKEFMLCASFDFKTVCWG